MVRIPDSQSGEAGSIPVGATKGKIMPKKDEDLFTEETVKIFEDVSEAVISYDALDSSLTDNENFKKVMFLAILIQRRFDRGMR